MPPRFSRCAAAAKEKIQSKPKPAYRKKPLAFARARKPECASRKKIIKTGRAVFFITPQSRELLQGMMPVYDGSASGGLLGGINTFGYANQNPLSYNDPLGLCGWCLPAAGVAAACYAVYKFFDSSNDALKSADQRQKMQNEMQDWIRDGMKGNPPYTEAQMQQADQQVIQDASKATTEGAKVTTQPLRTTGSLIKYFSK